MHDQAIVKTIFTDDNWDLGGIVLTSESFNYKKSFERASLSTGPSKN